MYVERDRGEIERERDWSKTGREIGERDIERQKEIGETGKESEKEKDRSDI